MRYRVDWPVLGYTLMLLVSAVAIFVGLVLGATVPGVGGFAWTCSVLLWAKCLAGCVEALMQLGYDRHLKTSHDRLVAGVMAGIEDRPAEEAEDDGLVHVTFDPKFVKGFTFKKGSHSMSEMRALMHDDVSKDDGERLMDEISKAVEEAAE